MALSLFALLITWVIAFPIGIFSAVRQYSIGDYIFTFLGFIGLAMPSFLLALVLMYVALQVPRPERRRAVLAGVQRRPVEPGQGRATC